MEDYMGQDGIVGRPIRLNKQTLTVKPRKDYAQLMLFGDLHLGHPNCLIEKAKEYLDWAKKNGVYVLLMGDLIEAGLTNSVGDSIYKQKLNPQEQMETVVEFLKDVPRIIGIHTGNHEARIFKNSGVNVTKVMAKLLGVPFLGYSCWSMLTVGGQKYSLYSTHGCSGSRFKHTKIKAVIDITQWISADLIAYGHVHAAATEKIIRQRVDFRNRQIKEESSHVVLTGAYLKWDNSYAQDKNYPITRVGSPTVKLFTKKRELAVSI